MLKLLFLQALLTFSSVASAQYVDIQNAPPPANYNVVFEHMEDTHIDFVLSNMSFGIEIPVSYFRQRNVSDRNNTGRILNEAFELFFLWAAENDYDLELDNHREIDLAVYDVRFSLLNDPDIIHFIPEIAKYRRQGISAMNGLYDHKSISGTNVIFVTAGRNHAETIAHELAHFLGDYFRVYDNYYKKPDGSIRAEPLAYEFEDYFRAHMSRN